MVNLTLVNGGIVEPGTYGSIVIRGDARILPGVRFSVLDIEGRVVCSDLEGVALRLKGDLYAARGTLRLSRISGSGRIIGACSIQLETLHFKGLIRGTHSLTALEEILFIGLMEHIHSIGSRQVDIHGVVKADRMIGTSIRIRALHPKRVAPHDVIWMNQNSRVELIQCADLLAERLEGLTLMADQVTLMENSLITELICRTQLTTDRHSAAVLVKGGCKRRHIAPA